MELPKFNETFIPIFEVLIEQIENHVKSELLDKLKSFDPYAFEEDQLGLEKIYIQAKKITENNVHETDIRNFIGEMSGDTTKGIFVTTTDFDEKAKRKATVAHHKLVRINRTNYRANHEANKIINFSNRPGSLGRHAKKGK